MTEPQQQLPSLFRLNIFQVLSEAQSNHGINLNDYKQYRTYCTRRLVRLRHAQPVKQLLVHNSKYTETSTKKKHQYVKRDTPKDIIHENIIWELLIQAERCWATANEKHPRTVVLRKYSKAVQFATQFFKVVQQSCDNITIQEAKSYTAWMVGNHQLQKRDYQQALQEFQTSMTILLDLANASSDSTSSLQQLTIRDIWTNRAENILRPLMRYCAYEAKLDIVEETAVQTAKESSMIVLEFCDTTVALDSYQDIAVLYLKMEKSLGSIGTIKDENDLLNLLTDLEDAMDMTNAEFKKYDALASGPAINAKKQDLQTLKNYFAYCKRSAWQRLQETHSTDRPEAAVRLYQSLQDNATAMAELIPEDQADDPAKLLAEAHVLRWRAHRCFELSKLYETNNEQLALLLHAKELTSRAVEELAACEDDETDVSSYLDRLETLQEEIENFILRVSVDMALEQHHVFNYTDRRPIWMRYHEYGISEVVVDNPPRPIPIPYKGVHYDMAWQEVTQNVPDLIAQLEEYIQDNASKKSSLLGWFSGK